ncbi:MULTISPECIES: pyridoxamine 5'-phosphate oxidase family protein [Psychrilyobacter]|uniref:Pyridoxamine 5'-phosphate oxidase n=1 Tax=Psychrilyobacter piezotolerans TaxID=2293438 RepID=A0ABX9KIU2_9FUSO|nr:MULTISPECIES: pyridoxamine 5'-phosphate oxidase family protein [Psychrilyobacter]MCS5421139.1 pyridoxamine 5'-phosphate oxidase family protein [Psychrilyobacter sp. S5]NDI77089.1 pyridoxamine 5'-phosphate oxidase [Psychrilyobacter piezotolerans]RDE64090.1 pyridoxamine 5'-phosphate oxidase [Psychrilyobacter sp. S5]REI42182.1 pyridoxamine 5'-phosphate oxidase [Psychrilyobacter piezotolerans]
MNEIIKFLEENPHTYLATVEKGEPRVRPFDFMYGEGNRFYFCTNNQKEVYNQLMVNPNVELSVMNNKMEWARLRGKTVFLDNITVKEKILEISPIVKSIYKTADNPALECFYIEKWEAVIGSLSGKPSKRYKSL